MNRIESYSPEAEGFELSEPAKGEIIGTGDSSKIKAESPRCAPEQAEGQKQLAQVAQPARDSGRDPEILPQGSRDILLRVYADLIGHEIVDSDAIAAGVIPPSIREIIEYMTPVVEEIRTSATPTPEAAR